MTQYNKKNVLKTWGLNKDNACFTREGNIQLFLSGISTKIIFNAKRWSKNIQVQAVWMPTFNLTGRDKRQLNKLVKELNNYFDVKLVITGNALTGIQLVNPMGLKSVQALIAILLDSEFIQDRIDKRLKSLRFDPMEIPEIQEG